MNKTVLIIEWDREVTGVEVLGVLPSPLAIGHLVQELSQKLIDETVERYQE